MAPPRELNDLMKDFQKAIASFDPHGKRQAWLREYLNRGRLPEELTEDKRLFYRLFKFERFLQREDGRVRDFPEQLRPIAASDSLDSVVRPEVIRDLLTWPPRQPWLELLCPFETPSDAERIRTLQGHTGPVNSVAWSPNGRRLVSASSDKTLIVWDADSGARECTLQGHNSFVTSVAWSPNGRRLVSASYDNTLIVWDADSDDSGAPERTLQGHNSFVTSVAWSPNGRRLVSASWDKTLIVWDADNGAILTCLPLEYAGRAIAWSPTEADRLVVGLDIGWVRQFHFHDADPAAMKTEW